MAASAYVFYVHDNALGPAFELLRRTCQPASRSTSHITLRAPIRALRDNDLGLYEATVVDHIHIVGPDSFGDVSTARTPVVFLRCESPLLESLSYKPDYPDSVFHLTVYDGGSRQFARRVLSVLREFRWSFDISMPPRRPSRIEMGRRRPPQTRVRLSRVALALLRDLRGSQATAADLKHLDDDARIALVRDICAYIHDSEGAHFSSSKRDSQMAVARTTARRLPRAQDFQPSLFDDGSDRTAELWWSTRRRETLDYSRSVGLFLTPPELAQDLIRSALAELPLEPLAFGDPAIGTGIFFATLLRHVGEGRIASAMGVEANAMRADQTRAKWAGAELDVQVGNFLEAELAPTRNLIVANPPYVRFQRLNRAAARTWAARIERSLGLTVGGQADLYVYFVLIAHDWLAPGGVSAWLLPTGFLHTNYASVLREYLTSRVSLVRLHTYDLASSRFENARVGSALVVFRNVPPGAAARATITTGPFAQPDGVWRVSLRSLRQAPKWSESLFASRANHAHPLLTVGDVFTVKRGIATGANSWFVVTDEQRRRLKIVRRWLKPVVPRARLLPSNIIDADRRGEPTRIPRLWLIDTNEPLAAIREQSEEFAEYLAEAQKAIGERRLVQSRKPFYSQEHRPPPPYFAGYMSRQKQSRLRSRFFLNRSNAVVLNNYLALYPKPELSRLLDAGILADTDVLDALASIDELTLAQEARTYVTGLQKLEPRDLARLPLESLAQLFESAGKSALSPPDVAEPLISTPR
jgi:adenine-specific DNA-methyltransferase